MKAFTKRSRPAVIAGLFAFLLFAAIQDVRSGTITVTTANDCVQLTNEAPQTYTGTALGSYTIAAASYNAVGTLTIIRSTSSLDYLWSATPDLTNTKGIGIRAVDAFTLSSAAGFELTFVGLYLDGYLWNTDTNTYVEKFGFKSGNVGPIPDFTITGFLAAGNYELRLNTGAVPTSPPMSGKVHFSVPEASFILLLAIGFGAVSLAAFRFRA